MQRGASFGLRRRSAALCSVGSTTDRRHRSCATCVFPSSSPGDADGGSSGTRSDRSACPPPIPSESSTNAQRTHGRGQEQGAGVRAQLASGYRHVRDRRQPTKKRVTPAHRAMRARPDGRIARETVCRAHDRGSPTLCHPVSPPGSVTGLLRTNSRTLMRRDRHAARAG
jgi:hypothetical protein